MERQNHSVHFFICSSIILCIFFLYGCAALNESKIPQNDKLYQRSYEEMINIAGNALRNNKLEIWDFVEKRGEGATITFGLRDALNNRSLPTVKGYIHIYKMDGEKVTRVKVQNPNYSYATPSEYRKNYERILMEEIDKLVSR